MQLLNLTDIDLAFKVSSTPLPEMSKEELDKWGSGIFLSNLVVAISQCIIHILVVYLPVLVRCPCCLLNC